MIVALWNLGTGDRMSASHAYSGIALDEQGEIRRLRTEQEGLRASLPVVLIQERPAIFRRLRRIHSRLVHLGAVPNRKP